MKKELEELQPNRLFANRDTLEEAFKNGMDRAVYIWNNSFNGSVEYISRSL